MTREERDAQWREILKIPPSARNERLFHQLQRDFGRPMEAWLVRNKLGPVLTREDIEEVVSDACFALWERFDASRGDRPSAYFHASVKNGTCERLRHFVARKASLLRGSTRLTPDADAKAVRSARALSGLDAMEDQE